MIPELRRRFNELWTPESYAELLRGIEKAAGTSVQFRCSETPVFLPKPLLEKMIRYGQELYGQLAANPEYRRASDKAIPPQFRVPNESEHPLFVQADFGVIREPDGTLEPKLVEIQGFPSVYGFQVEAAKQYQRVYRLNEAIDPGLTTFLDGLDEDSYWQSANARDSQWARAGRGGSARNSTARAEDIARFSGDRKKAGDQNRLHHRRAEKRPEAFPRRQPDQADLQPCDCGRTGPKEHSGRFSIHRRSGCRVGRASELVFPAQQVFPALVPARERSRNLVLE